MHLLFKSTLYKEIQKYSNKKILVAFSGGKDSLSLLHFLYKNKEELNLDLYSCYVFHGLRETALRDEIFCKEKSLEYNIPFFVENISEDIKGDNSSSTEAIARKYRYERLLKLKETLLCDYIFTAHTYSDNIENFFIDLYTGASIFSISGINYDLHNVIRPMLNITTEMVNAYLNSYNIEPTYDETNEDTNYVRNKIRHNILPNLIQNGIQFEKTILNLQAESALLKDYFIKKTYKAVIFNDFANEDNFKTLNFSKFIKTPFKSICINKDEFLNFESIEREFLLGLLFSNLFRMSKNLIKDVIYNFEKESNNSKLSKRLDLPNNYCIDVSYDFIRIYLKDNINPINFIKEAGNSFFENSNLKIEFQSCEKDYISRKLVIRHRKNGDRVTFKNGSSKKLKDLYINKQIELVFRDSAIIIEDFNSHEIIYAEHVFMDQFVIIQYK